jgi:large subunit ribosomal protein L23
MNALITVTPRATEKAYGQVKNNVYVFDVPLTANKNEITAAIESQFEVRVTKVKTLVQTGKKIRFSRGKMSRPGTTFRKNFKKAYVTLAEGDSIQVFDETSNEESKAEATKETK